MGAIHFIAFIAGIMSQAQSGPMTRESRAADCRNPIVRSALPESFVMPVFGRDFQLGSLYNAVTDTVIHAEERICNWDTLRQLTRETKQSFANPDIKVFPAKDWITRVGSEGLSLPRNLQLSIATGLVNLTNEGRMLHELPPNRMQVQTILSESHDWLSVALDDVAQPCGFYYTFHPAVTGATHYVSEIQFGYQRIAVLTKTLDRSEMEDEFDRRDAQADLNLLTEDIANGVDIRMPPLFANNLTVTLYRSDGNVNALKYADIYEFDKYFQSKYFLESGPSQISYVFPIRVKLAKIPIFAEDIKVPVVSLTFYDIDIQMESYYADTLTSSVGQNYENYRRYVEKFLSNFQQFRTIFMHHLRSAVYRHRTNSADEEEAVDPCDVSQLMSVRASSPFSNDVSQVWAQILHRQLAKADEFMAQFSSPDGCSRRAGFPCLVEVQFNFKEANADKILTDQKSFLPEFARNFTEAGILFKRQSTDLDAARNLTDISLEEVNAKLEALDKSRILQQLTSLHENCNEQLQLIFSVNVKTPNPKFITFSLDGTCSVNVQALLVVSKLAGFSP